MSIKKELINKIDSLINENNDSYSFKIIKYINKLDDYIISSSCSNMKKYINFKLDVLISSLELKKAIIHSSNESSYNSIYKLNVSLNNFILSFKLLIELNYFQLDDKSDAIFQLLKNINNSIIGRIKRLKNHIDKLSLDKSLCMHSVVFEQSSETKKEISEVPGFEYF